MQPDRARGSASVLEYTLVLPLCFIAVGMVFLMGFFLCRYALISAAAYRAVLIVKSAYEDCNYLDIADLGLSGMDEPDHIGVKERRDLNGLIDCELYRFLGIGDGYGNAGARAAEKAKVIINRAGLPGVGITAGQPDVHIRIASTGMGRKAYVEITQRIGFPLLQDAVVIRAHADATLLSPAEMIRNTDYILQLAERYTGVDVSSKLIEAVTKAQSLFCGGSTASK